jgi:TRAP-type uncharacterized transport system substrate-binding protein
MRIQQLLSILLFTLSLPWAHAADTSDTESGIVISAGREGLGYWGIATRLQAVALESSLPVEVRESVGATENLKRLADPESPVSLALTQSDALSRYLDLHPGFQVDLEIFESIGKECIFVIADKNSDLRSEDDLRTPDAGHRLAIQSANSGSAVTFELMRKLAPDLGNTEVVYMDTQVAMEQLGTDSPDAVDAIMLVHRPKVRSPELRRALTEPERYRLVSFNNPDLGGKLPNGDPVYVSLDVPLIRNNWKTERSIRTLCMEGLLVGSRNKLSPAERARLVQIIELQWMRIYVGKDQ